MLLYFPFIFLWGEILIVMCSSEKEVLQTPSSIRPENIFLYLFQLSDRSISSFHDFNNELLRVFKKYQELWSPCLYFSYSLLYVMIIHCL